MNNEEVLKEYFIWEEKNLIKQLMKSENNGVNDQKDTTIETKNDSTLKDWKDITDPKLRKNVRQKIWREANKDKIKIYNKTSEDKRKNYYKLNKDRIKLRKKIYREINKEKIKEQNKTYYETNKNKIKCRVKYYRQLNLDKIKEKKKNYYNKNKVKVLKKSTDYYIANKENKKEYDKVYNKINKKKINAYKRFRHKNDIQYKLACNLRTRLRSAINGNHKSGSAVKDLGCSISELKTYLESKFLPGMTWDNWNQYGWHIDHIKPLSSFNLTDREQLLEACHYTNLQPLWATDNLSKNNRY